MTSLAVNYIIPYITNADEGNLVPKPYLIFAGAMGTCFIVAFFFYPEVKGRTPAELDEMFEARLPARAFKSKSDL